MIHLFIINPAAGSRDRTKQYRKNIEEICGMRGLNYRIEVSSAPGECYRIAREAAESERGRAEAERAAAEQRRDEALAKLTWLIWQ